MKRFSTVMFLIGTLCCSALASDPKTEQFDRDELRLALERFVRETPGFVPDLRPNAPSVTEQARQESERREHRANTNPCADCDRVAKALTAKSE